MNCPTCGASVKAGAEFCDNCGARLHTAQHVSESPQYSNNPFTGFSRMVDSEEVLAAIRKQKRITLFAWIGLVLVVLIGFLAFGAISSSMEIVQALAYGVVIDVIIIIAMLILTLRKALSKPFEGTVEQKRTSIRLGNGRRRSRRSRRKYMIRFDCEDGKRRKKEVPLAVFHYLQEGDRVRYLPKFPQPFEKYKTATDTETVCMICGHTQPLVNDSCSICHNPLIK